MKKVGIGIGVLVIAGLIYFAVKAMNEKAPTVVIDDEGQEREVVQESEEVSEQAEAKPIAPKVVPKTPEAKEKLDAYVTQLENLVETNRQEVEECEAGIDRIFCSNIENEGDAVYNEENVMVLLDEFDQTPIVPKSSSKLLEVLAQDELQFLDAEDLGNKLKDLRPCRPYKKMSFVHNLMANYKKNKWSESTKKRVLGTVFNYFDRELADRTTLSNLNMQAALLQTMVSEGVLPKKYEETILDYKDELEDSYDELLDKADELKEEAEEKGSGNEKFIPVQIIKQEYQMEPQQREAFKKLLNGFRKEMNI